MENQGWNLEGIVKYRDIAWSIGEVVLSSALSFVTKRYTHEIPLPDGTKLIEVTPENVDKLLPPGELNVRK
jgi:hypothetical protein